MNAAAPKLKQAYGQAPLPGPCITLKQPAVVRREILTMPGQSLNMHIIPLPEAALHHFSDTGKAGTPAHIAAYRTGTMLAIAQAWLGVIKHLATHSGNHDIAHQSWDTSTVSRDVSASSWQAA